MIAGISAGLVIEIVERSIDAATGKYDKKDGGNSSSTSSNTSSNSSSAATPSALVATTALFTQNAPSAAVVTPAPKTTGGKTYMYLYFNW